MDLAIVRRTGMAAYLDSTAVTVFMVEVKRPRDRCGFEDGDFVMNSENPCDLFKAHADQVLAQVWIRCFRQLCESESFQVAHDDVPTSVALHCDCEPGR